MTKPNLVTRFHIAMLAAITGVTATAIYKIPADDGLVMHWDAHGQPDWLWPRDLAFAVVPTLAVILVAAFAIGGMLTPKGRLEMARHILEPALTWVLGLGLAIQVGLLALGMGSDFDIIRIVAFAAAAGLLLLGILLREAERHTYAGLRLPWGMRDDGVWRRTHQIAGWTYIAGAIVLAALAWLQPFPAVLVITMPLILVIPVTVARLASLGAGKA